MTGTTGAAADAADGAPCLNCGTRLIGAHCHACGQSAHVHRSLGAIGHELAHGVFHFEGRIWRTLPMLALRPGELTRRYVAGERARFVSPLALFLFVIFVVFAMLSVVGAHLEAPEFGTENRNATATQLKQQIAEENEKLAVTVRRRGAASDPAGIARLDGRIVEMRREIGVLQTSHDVIARKRGVDALANVKIGWKRLDKGLAKAAENPNLMLYKIQSNAYKFAWALIPLSLPFMWLLFPFSRRFHMYDHAIFVTYSLCFVTLLGTAISIVGLLGLPQGATRILWIAAAIAIPIHIYKQLRGAYGLGRPSALIRAVLLFVAASIALVLFVLLLLGLGLVG